MINPIATSKAGGKLYLLLWLIIALVHGSLLFFALGQPMDQAIWDAIIFNFLFALFGYSIWYVVRYSGLNPENIGNTIVTHFASAALLIGLWLYVAPRFTGMILGPDLDYRAQFRPTIYYRAAIGVLYYVLIVLNYYLANFYREYQEQKLKESETNRLLKETELSMLKAQINPHFIFNSLNSISSLTLTNPEKAHDMVINLSSFLRYTISPRDAKKVKLEDELQAIEQYLAIEKVRFGSRLNVDITCDDAAAKSELPNMILQPLVENAIKYGVYESTGENHINISCSKAGKAVKVVISNNKDPEAIPKKGKGIGLENVKSRLKLIYDAEHLLNIQKTDDLFTVTILIPQK